MLDRGGRTIRTVDDKGPFWEKPLELVDIPSESRSEQAIAEYVAAEREVLTGLGPDSAVLTDAVVLHGRSPAGHQRLAVRTQLQTGDPRERGADQKGRGAEGTARVADGGSGKDVHGF